MNLLPPEFTPILVDQHQRYLRSLGVEHDRFREKPRRTRRQAVGELLVRFGRWLEGHCPELTFEPASATARPAGCV